MPGQGGETARSLGLKFGIEQRRSCDALYVYAFDTHTRAIAHTLTRLSPLEILIVAVSIVQEHRSLTITFTTNWCSPPS